MRAAWIVIKKPSVANHRNGSHPASLTPSFGQRQPAGSSRTNGGSKTFALRNGATQVSARWGLSKPEVMG